MEDYTFIYHNEKYNVHFVPTKRNRSSLRFKMQGGVLNCYAHESIPRSELIKVIERHRLSLVRTYKREQTQNEEGIYIFGELKTIRNHGSFYEISGVGVYKNEVEKAKLLQRLLYRYLEKRFSEIAKEMHVRRTYRYHIRNMKTRYGTNSLRTMYITFSLQLVHFSPAIIDSVIVHEFAHDFYRDHSPNFYRVVYQYCPNYDELRKLMVKGEFHE